MKRFLTWSAILVLLLFGVGFLISFFMERSARGTVNALHEEITQAGDKLVLSDYTQDLVADEDNAFYHLFKEDPTADVFVNAYFSTAPVESLQGWTPESEAMQPDPALEELVADHQALFDRFEKASQCETYWPDVDYSLGFNAPLSHIPQVRSVSRCIAAKARILATSGDVDEALRTCTIGMRIHRLMETEPSLVAQLSSLAGEQLILDAAHYTLMTSNPSADVRAEFDQALARLNLNRAMTNALKGERALGVMTFEQLRSGEFESMDEIPMSGFTGGTLLGKAYLYDDEETYLRMMNTQIDMVEKPYAERDPILDSMEAELEESGFRNIVTKLLFPAMRRTIDAKDDLETKIRCMRIILSAYGQTELELESVPEEIRVDPYTGQEMIVKPVDDGWIVYGVGRNQTDDGGEIFVDSERGAMTPDIGFHSAPQ